MDKPDPEAVNAAREAIAPDRLLPGEDPERHLLEDAEHWVAVYTELLTGKSRILDLTVHELQSANYSETQDELVHDRTLLLAELERFQRRLRFWNERELELRRSS
jgi:hypothetical protein